ASKNTAGMTLLTVSDSLLYGTNGMDVVSGNGSIYSYDLLTPQMVSVGSDHLLLGVDPKLKDVPNGDFHLTMTSPAIDAADPNTALEIDFDGNARPVGTARDLGAYEFRP
ncbi:MAG TPA: choice-of-anchor Q domain-containing protein, partial [Kofleriaceae bacterium]|nr:choice-of-anchor Q domain-containing protein [Kofleriaceae bacterium]